MVKENPALYQQVISSVSPYHEMVDVVSKAEKFEQMQNVESYEAKMRAEIEAKIREEYETRYTQKAAKKTSITPSLNNQRSADGGASTETLGDLSLEDIFQR